MVTLGQCVKIARIPTQWIFIKRTCICTEMHIFAWSCIWILIGDRAVLTNWSYMFFFYLYMWNRWLWFLMVFSICKVDFDEFDMNLIVEAHFKKEREISCRERMKKKDICIAWGLLGSFNWIIWPLIWLYCRWIITGVASLTLSLANHHATCLSLAICCRSLVTGKSWYLF